jgi:hypothetical protein
VKVGKLVTDAVGAGELPAGVLVADDVPVAAVGGSEASGDGVPDEQPRTRMVTRPSRRIISHRAGYARFLEGSAE